MLTVRQVAERLEISARQVRALIRARQLRALNLSRNPVAAPRYRIDPRDLERFIAHAATDTAPARVDRYPGRGRRRATPARSSSEATDFLDRVLTRRSLARNRQPGKP